MFFGSMHLFQSCNKSKNNEILQFKVEEFVPSYIQVDSVTQVKLKPFGPNDYIVFGLDKNNEFENKFVSIFSLDPYNRVWEQKYSELFYSTPFVDTGSVSLFNKQFIIISTIEGSGGYLSYKVLGYKNDSIKIFLTRDMIFQGSVFFYGNQIIEKEGEKSLAYIFNGEYFSSVQLISTPFRPLNPNDVLFEYSIDSLSNINAPDSIKIKKGNKLFIVRYGLGPTERILFSDNDDILEYHREYYLAKEIGTCILTISPGYERGKDIIVEVYE